MREFRGTEEDLSSFRPLYNNLQSEVTPGFFSDFRSYIAHECPELGERRAMIG